MRDSTILIVDDEADVSTYLRAFFEDNGFAAVTAENGKEGFAKAKQLQPALITLDITMPEESGVRMLKDLQDDSAVSGGASMMTSSGVVPPSWRSISSIPR